MTKPALAQNLDLVTPFVAGMRQGPPWESIVDFGQVI